jgi:hypothetical protein
MVEKVNEVMVVLVEAIKAIALVTAFSILSISAIAYNEEYYESEIKGPPVETAPNSLLYDIIETGRSAKSMERFLKGLTNIEKEAALSYHLETNTHYVSKNTTNSCTVHRCILYARQ